MLYYVPGCNFAAKHPDVSKKLVKYMRGRGASIGPCCKRDLRNVTAEDTVVTNCTLCDIMFPARLPGIRLISLYEYVLEDPQFPWKDHGGEPITLQDCWRSRDDIRLQDSVRACLLRMGFVWEELPDAREKSTYCGNWLNKPADPVCVELAPKQFEEINKYRHLTSEEEQYAAMRERMKAYSTDSVAIYCNVCEEGIEMGGKTPRHVAVLLSEGL